VDSHDAAAGPPAGVEVDDVHSRLNATRMARVARPGSIDALQEALAASRRDGLAISLAGGRHAMGGQQFAAGGVLIDTRDLRRVLSFDPGNGIVEVEAGIEWPDLIAEIRRLPEAAGWGIAQKQTGADRMTLGGSLSANVHGRGLTMPPIVADVESFDLLLASGERRRCDRQENADLFSLAIGGYGLFGVIVSVRLRLSPRRKMERQVEIETADGLIRAFEERVAAGFLYGDFQFSIDPSSRDFLRRGVFACYRPVDDDAPIAETPRELSEADWTALVRLTHFDKAQAFERYARFYLATSGQIYWSDTHQLSIYLDDYHRALDAEAGRAGTEMITELYVPRSELSSFLDAVAEDVRRDPVDVIYGTVRLVERDTESFLSWAREPWACVIFNLHVDHAPERLAAAQEAFRRLIDRALERGGSYYLTYHRWARRDQVERAYPKLPELLRRKRAHDPDELLQSDWYRHYRELFRDAL
jgi:FAD/FMN-containing dehydrogenase